MLIADRIVRLRQSFRMRTEHHRPRFGRAIGVGRLGLRQRAMDRLHQAGAHRRRAHADELDAGQIGFRQRLRLAQHHGDHRRHRREPGRAIVPDRLDVGLRLELRQQHDGRVRRAGELGQRQRVHVIERRRDQIAVPLEIGREPRLHHPDVALVREHDALRHSGRARRVEEHRGLALLRHDRLELAAARRSGRSRRRRPRRTRRPANPPGSCRGWRGRRTRAWRRRPAMMRWMVFFGNR